MELVSNYMRDDTLRHALNELTRKTLFSGVFPCVKTGDNASWY